MSESIAETIVRTFCKAWERRDLEAILAMVGDDIVYQNVPAPPMHGKRAFRDFIFPIVRDTVAIEFELRALAATGSGDKVLTERLDRLHYPSGVIEIPLMGVFVVRDERVVEWREYSDFASIDEAVGRLGVDLAPGQG